jgi:hypothetical protein
MEEEFGRSRTWISIIFNDTIAFLAERFRSNIQWHPILTYERIQKYAQALTPYTAGVEAIWGFLDGTFRGFCRPDQNQQTFYSGHKHEHGFKYQAIVAADGLCVALHGPYEGKVNDFLMVTDSGVQGRLNEVSSGQKLYRKITYNARHRACRYFIDFSPKIDDLLTCAMLRILLKLTCIYSRSSRIAIHTFYMEIRPINHLPISLGPMQAIGLLLLISNI